MDREKSAKMNRMDFSSVKCQDLGFVITHRTGGRAALWTRPLPLPLVITLADLQRIPPPAAHLLLRLDKGLHASLTVLGSQGARLAPVVVVQRGLSLVPGTWS